MYDFLVSLSQDKKTLQISCAVIFLYSWSFLNRSSYVSFFSGVLFTLIVEALLFWNYLVARIKKQSGDRITVELAQVEVKKIFGDEINYYEVEQKMKKKKYYENNRSKNLFSANPIAEVQPKPKPEASPAEAQIPQDKTTPPAQVAEQNMSFSHKQINELIKKKETDQNKDKVAEPKPEIIPKKPVAEGKMSFTKTGRKAFMSQMNGILNILTRIGESERIYGRALVTFDGKYELFVQADTPALKLEDQQVDSCKLRMMSEKDMNFLKERFGEGIAEKKRLYLPEWKKLKQTVTFMGQVHLNCSKYVSKVSVGKINSVMTENEEKSGELKKEKRRLLKEYEEAQFNYTKLKTEFDTLNKTLETTLTEYQAKFKLKKNDEVVLKHEMKARLVKSQIDNLANKLSDAEDKLQEARKAIEAENEKIAVFVQGRDEKKENICQNVLKNVVSSLAKTMNDIESSFEVLFQTEIKAYNPSDKLPEEFDTIKTGENEEDKSLDEIIKKGRKSFGANKAVSPMVKKTRPVVKNAEGEENKFVKIIDEYKETIEELDITYNEDLFVYNEEAKKSRDIATMLKHLGEYEDEFTKERDKLVSISLSSGVKMDTLSTYWKMIQNNIYLINRLNSQLKEKLLSLDKLYGENMKGIEKDFKASDLIIQNALKKAGLYVKSLEKELLKKEVSKDKKDFFSKIFHSDGKGGLLNDDNIVTEKIQFIGEMEKGLIQINELTKKSKKEAISLKKDMMMAYLQCYTAQQNLFNSLVDEVEKICPQEIIEEETKEPEKPVGEIEAQKGEQPEAEVQSAEKVNVPEEPTSAISADSTAVNKELQPQPQLQDIQMKGPSQQPQEAGVDLMKEYQGPENLIWFNKMFKVFALEWAKSGYFKEKIMKIFFKSFNKKRSKFVRRIKIKDLIVDPKFPDIRSISPLPSDSFEFLYDAHMVYQGNIMMEIETRLEPQPVLSLFSGGQPIPLTVKVLIKSFNGVVRLCWVPSEYGRSWYSFVGQPIMNLIVEPKIGVSQFDMRALPIAKTLITDLINKKIRKMTWPYRKEVDLPLAFRSPKFELPPE